jgi:hypothetical protein
MCIIYYSRAENKHGVCWRHCWLSHSVTDTGDDVDRSSSIALDWQTESELDS